MSKCSSDSISAACAAVGWKDGVLDSIICSKPLSKIPKKWGPSSEHCKRGCTTCQAAQSHLCARAGAARHLFHFPKLKQSQTQALFSFSRTHQGGMAKELVGGRKFGGFSFSQWMFLCTPGCFSVPEWVGVWHILPHKAHEDTSYRITHCFLLMSTSCPSMPTLPQSSWSCGNNIVEWALCGSEDMDWLWFFKHIRSP